MAQLPWANRVYPCRLTCSAKGLAIGLVQDLAFRTPEAAGSHFFYEWFDSCSGSWPNQNFKDMASVPAFVLHWPIGPWLVIG